MKRVRVAATTEAARALNPRERAFVREYVLHLNGSAAYISSGLGKPGRSGETYRSSASRLLKNPRIANAVEAEFELQAARNNITKERLTTMLLDSLERAVARRNSNAEVTIISQLGKLHGFFTEKHQHVHLRLNEMSEEDIKEFLGDNYDPTLIQKLGRVIEHEDVKMLPPKRASV